MDSNEKHSVQTPKRIALVAANVAAIALLGGWWIWACCAILFYSPVSFWIRVAWLLLFVAGDATLLIKASTQWKWLGMVVSLAVPTFLWGFVKPSNDRDWSLDQARMPIVSFEGDWVRVQNVRHATYETVNDYTVNWEDRVYNLEQLVSIDFVIEHFGSWNGAAHTFLTFGFKNDEYVSISVETRREKGEGYGLIKGMFKQYELTYIVGDERDLIGVRTNVRNDPVYLFPIKTTRENMKLIFIQMLERAAELRNKPEFYHTIHNNCTTSIVRHMEQLTNNELPFDVRILLPGYSDSLAFELGLIDFEGTLDDAREKYHVNDRSSFGPDKKEWSRRLRQLE